MRCYVDMLLITSTANIKTWERDNGLYGGLSPLARGTQPVRWVLGSSKRFIPAGAGNTRQGYSTRSKRSVYPRWRGEHHSEHWQNHPDSGLPPLTRGTRRLVSCNSWIIWFIPAGAGNSYQLDNDGKELSVYPRWRGELSDIWLDARGIYGLSPLARGTLIAGGSFDCLTRFIPASAGNS